MKERREGNFDSTLALYADFLCEIKLHRGNSAKDYGIASLWLGLKVLCCWMNDEKLEEAKI